RPEPVEGLPFSLEGGLQKQQGFDKLSPNG
ncbi:MAG: hypothetical protein RLZ59_5, partial [Pseudomonadota bacterium]